MDFFAAQDAARERTGRLLWFFAGAVLLTVLSVHLGVEVLLAWYRGTEFHFRPHWALLPWTAGATLLPMAIGVVSKWASLSGGGAAVAEALGGRRIAPDAGDFHEKRLLNVVEEVAIASGVRVPEVWVLDEEPAINAFAAGADPSSAVVAVSRGCLERLSRDELQGVVAHECSHILNGDMRLNFHMMAWIAGILVLSVLGQVLIRIAPHTIGRAGSSSGSGRKQEGSSLPMILFVSGLALLVIGSVGAFFARWIQAAISRQREFLADASAVQFTRNPQGISGALKKIGGLDEGSQLEAPRAKEVSHMLFCDGATGFFSALFATHPPLTERIRRLDPEWQGEMLEGPAQEPGKTDAAESGAVPVAGPSGSQGFAAASELLAGLPAAWVDLARNPASAGRLVLELLQAFEDESASDSEGGLAVCSVPQRMALLDLALSAARQLPKAQVRELLAACERQAFGDGVYNLFEMMLLQSIRRHLGVASGLRAAAAVRYADGMSLKGPMQIVLSAVAALGAEEEGARDASFQRGWGALRLGDLPRLDVALIPVAAIERALQECEQATAALRGTLLQSCMAVASADGVYSDLEIAFIRAVGDAMGVPVQPLS
jgi:Zn-dependent protease with chaperone function